MFTGLWGRCHRSKTGQDDQHARTENPADSLILCYSIPLTSPQDPVTFASAAVARRAWVDYTRTVPTVLDMVVVMDMRNRFLGLKSSLTLDIGSARTTLACLQLGRVMPQPYFFSVVEVTLGLVVVAVEALVICNCPPCWLLTVSLSFSCFLWSIRACSYALSVSRLGLLVCSTHRREGCALCHCMSVFHRSAKSMTKPVVRTMISPTTVKITSIVLAVREYVSVFVPGSDPF